MTTHKERDPRRLPSSSGRRGVPYRVFDAHLHIIDPAFPVVANVGWLPPPFEEKDYLRAVGQASLSVVGGAVVSASFQSFDQTFLLHALSQLGPTFVGVTQIPASTSDREVLRLNGSGVRAVRFNLLRGGSESRDHLLELGKRIHSLAGWHVELYAGCDELVELAPLLERLPRVVVDHMGLPSSIRDPGFKALLRLVERGVYVKASGFGRFRADAAMTLAAVARVNPSALMFGTDLPSTRAPRPFRPEDVELIVDTLGEEQAGRVLHDNALALYRVVLPDAAS